MALRYTQIGPDTNKTNIAQGTTIVDTRTAGGGTGKYTVNISQSNLGATITGWIGTYYDGDLVDLPFDYTSQDPDETITVRLVSGELPLGLTLSPAGRLYGYIEPAANVNQVPGYDETQIDTVPYDFVVSAINKNYQFTLEVTDGKSSSLRTFYFFVYDRSTLTADTTQITADTTTATADETTERRPFIVNADPSDLGTVRGDNYFAYQFVGENYVNKPITSAISVNQGAGLPPGPVLDPTSGWYYGYIPNQGVTEVTYSFNIYARQTDVIGTAITCTATTAGTSQYVTANAQANITSVGVLTSVSSTGNITAPYYIGNGSQLTGVVKSIAGNLAGNIDTLEYSINSSNGEVRFGNTISVVGNATITNDLIVGDQIATTGNITTAANVYAQNFIGNVYGNVFANILVPGANTDVLFNTNGEADATSGLTFNILWS